LYFLRDELKKDHGFIEKNLNDLAASLQTTIIDILMEKLEQVAHSSGIKEIALAGGVSANSGLRNRILELAATQGWKTHIPEFRFTTDNAAMIAITGYYKYHQGEFADQGVTPMARMHF
jgi:N6-L-threonylcarbamoyladenine synthase